MRGPFGLSLSLEENSIKPLYCGDREIWLDYYQNILREARLLPDFLPEVRFDKNRVTFYNMVSGRDIVSRSKPARNIPKKEWQDLTFRLKNLQAKLDCNDTTADARKFIESFKLPLPTSLEYFRIYKGRLIVLWGFYKENENDLKDLVEVVSPEAQEEIKYNNIMGCLRKILIFLIFILLCLLGFRYIDKNYLNSDTTSQKSTSGGGGKEGTPPEGTGTGNQEKKDTPSKGTGPINQEKKDTPSKGTGPINQEKKDTTSNETGSKKQENNITTSNETGSKKQENNITTSNGTGSKKQENNGTTSKGTGSKKQENNGTTSKETGSKKQENNVTTSNGTGSKKQENNGTTSKGTGPINQEKKDTTSKGTGTVNQSEIDITPIALGKENGKLWVAIEAQSENPVKFSVINSKGGAEYKGSFPPGKNQKELLLDEGEYTLRYSTEKTEKSISFRVKSEISLILSNSTENSD